MRVVAEPVHRVGAVSFVLEDPPVSVLDVGTRLDLEGIAVRTGHHCCQPLMQRLGVLGTVRASFSVYNTVEEVEALAACMRSMVDQKGHPRTHAAIAPCPDLRPLDYPAASASTVEAAAQALATEFEGLRDWAERYEYLIELGRNLPSMPSDLKTEVNRVRGCQSTVFLSPRARPGSADVVEFLADSESEIVRGLIGLLQEIFSGQPALQIVEFDLSGLLSRLGLATNLTMSRRNGLAEMVKRLRSFAAGLAARQPQAPLEEFKVAV